MGFTAADGAHSVGLLVDHDDSGIARDLWIGPPLDAIAADARTDPDLVVTDLPLPETRTLAEAALATASESGGFLPDDERLLPLPSSAAFIWSSSPFESIRAGLIAGDHCPWNLGGTCLVVKKRSSLGHARRRPRPHHGRVGSLAPPRARKCGPDLRRRHELCPRMA